MGLVGEEERNKSDKKKGKLNLKIKKEKKKVSVFATTHKKLQLLEEELYNLGMKMPVQTFVTLWVAITIGLPTIMMMLGVVPMQASSLWTYFFITYPVTG